MFDEPYSYFPINFFFFSTTMSRSQEQLHSLVLTIHSAQMLMVAASLRILAAAEAYPEEADDLTRRRFSHGIGRDLVGTFYIYWRLCLCQM